MKTKNIFLFVLLTILSLASCTKDGDLVTLDSNANGSDINLVGTCIGTLDENHTSSMALALYWNDNTSKQMQTNYSDVLVKKFAVTNYVQLSSDPSFSMMQEYEIDDSCYNHTFSTSELNSACAAIGFEPYKNSPLYVRLAARTGINIDPTYSNVLTYDVTPYREYGRYLIFDQWDAGYTADKLYPTTDEGIYGGTVHRLTAAKALNGDEYEFPMFVVSMDLDTDPQYGCTLTAHWNYNTQQGSVAGNTLYPTQVYEQYAMQGQYGDYQLVSDADFDPNYQFDGTVHAFSGHIVISFYQYEDFQAYCEAQGIAQPTIADVQASGTMKDLDLTLNNYTFQAASK